jgi:hypothetical protein
MKTCIVLLFILFVNEYIAQSPIFPLEDYTKAKDLVKAFYASLELTPGEKGYEEGLSKLNLNELKRYVPTLREDRGGNRMFLLETDPEGRIGKLSGERNADFYLEVLSVDTAYKDNFYTKLRGEPTIEVFSTVKYEVFEAGKKKYTIINKELIQVRNYGDPTTVGDRYKIHGWFDWDVLKVEGADNEVINDLTKDEVYKILGIY